MSLFFDFFAHFFTRHTAVRGLKGNGVALASVSRPLGETKVTCKRFGVEEKRDDRVEVLEG